MNLKRIYFRTEKCWEIKPASSPPKLFCFSQAEPEIIHSQSSEIVDELLLLPVLLCCVCTSGFQRNLRVNVKQWSHGILAGTSGSLTKQLFPDSKLILKEHNFSYLRNTFFLSENLLFHVPVGMIKNHLIKKAMKKIHKNQVKKSMETALR